MKALESCYFPCYAKENIIYFKATGDYSNLLNLSEKCSEIDPISVLIVLFLKKLARCSKISLVSSHNVFLMRLIEKSSYCNIQHALFPMPP